MNKSYLILDKALYLEQQLHHLSVYEALDRLSVDVSDEVTCSQSCLMCWTALLYRLWTQKLTIIGQATF